MLPGTASTVIITLLFGVFDAIPACVHSERARQANATSRRYWEAFWWSLAAWGAAWVLLILVVVVTSPGIGGG
jgi:hypothetical protein